MLYEERDGIHFVLWWSVFGTQSGLHKYIERVSEQMEHLTSTSFPVLTESWNGKMKEIL
jgi:hypothetical protein